MTPLGERPRRRPLRDRSLCIRRVRSALAVCIFFVASHSIALADTLTVEVMGGSALNLPASLTVHQRGFPDIRVSGARYETRAFGKNPYAVWRVGLWDGDRGWEVEHIHHRLFLTNPPPEIQVFAIHFGYNYFLCGRAWKHSGWIYRAAAGPIVTNPENTVRGRKFHKEPGFLDTGNFFSGIGTRAGVARNVPLTEHLFLVGEGAFTAGFAWSVPVVDGSANVPNFAVHGHLGVGIRF